MAFAADERDNLVTESFPSSFWKRQPYASLRQISFYGSYSLTMSMFNDVVFVSNHYVMVNIVNTLKIAESIEYF